MFAVTNLPDSCQNFDQVNVLVRRGALKKGTAELPRVSHGCASWSKSGKILLDVKMSYNRVLHSFQPKVVEFVVKNTTQGQKDVSVAELDLAEYINVRID